MCETPGVWSVDMNAAIESANATIWPMIASEAAALRWVPDTNKINNDAASGTAGISQTLLAIQEIIL